MPLDSYNSIFAGRSIDMGGHVRKVDEDKHVGPIAKMPVESFNIVVGEKGEVIHKDGNGNILPDPEKYYDVIKATEFANVGKRVSRRTRKDTVEVAM